jgi:hypothetical protein
VSSLEIIAIGGGHADGSTMKRITLDDQSSLVRGKNLAERRRLRTGVATTALRKPNGAIDGDLVRALPRRCLLVRQELVGNGGAGGFSYDETSAP